MQGTQWKLGITLDEDRRTSQNKKALLGDIFTFQEDKLDEPTQNVFLCNV